MNQNDSRETNDVDASASADCSTADLDEYRELAVDLLRIVERARDDASQKKMLAIVQDNLSEYGIRSIVQAVVAKVYNEMADRIKVFSGQ